MTEVEELKQRLAKVERDNEILWKGYLEIRNALRHANIHVVKPDQEDRPQLSLIPLPDPPEMTRPELNEMHSVPRAD